MFHVKHTLDRLRDAGYVAHMKQTSQVGIRLPDDMVTRIDALIAAMARGSLGIGVTRSDVMRLALDAGLESLEATFKSRKR